MWIHFADASSERGQYAALLGEGISATLVSYHYLRANRSTERAYEKLWEDQVNLHFAAWPKQEPQVQALQGEGVEKHLATYAHPEQIRGYEEKIWKEGETNLHMANTTDLDAAYDAMAEEDVDKHLVSYPRRHTMDRREKAGLLDLRPRVIIDSGAFTAHTTGKPILLEEYVEWAIRFRARWEPRMRSLHFINLDVIGDQRASWRNHRLLSERGLDTLPVIQTDATRKDVQRALAEHEYICLGGLVGARRSKLQPWLDRIFSEVMAYREREGALRKIHLLGVTTKWALNRYPIFSCDSSSWTQALRYGNGWERGSRLPRYSQSPENLAATMRKLREEIRSYKEMEAAATALWKHRGIEWEE